MKSFHLVGYCILEQTQAMFRVHLSYVISTQDVWLVLPHILYCMLSSRLPERAENIY